MKSALPFMVIMPFLLAGALLGACQQEGAGAWLLSEEGKSQAAIAGRVTFLRDCAVCHGVQGQGVEGLGKQLIANPFIAGLDDAGVAEFIAAGRPVDHPLNTTGVDMLPYGGQDPFSPEVMAGLVAYLRQLSAVQATVEPRPLDLEGAEGPEPAIADANLSEEEQKQAISLMLRARPKCFTCHRIGDRGNKSGPGPDLSHIGLTAQTRVEGMSARAYLEQSILDPGAYIVPDCPAGPCINAMPKEYAKQLNEEKVEAIVRYLSSLQTPKR